jgi:hypothetical protein
MPFLMKNEKNRHIKTALLEFSISKLPNTKLNIINVLMEKSPSREDDG